MGKRRPGQPQRIPAAVAVLCVVAALGGARGSACSRSAPPPPQNSTHVEPSECCVNQALNPDPIVAGLRARLRPLPVEEARRRLPEWLRLAALGGRAIHGARISPARVPEPEGNQDLGKDIVPVPAVAVDLDTALGAMRLYRIDPKSPASRPRCVCILQHGHGNVTTDWPVFARLVADLQNAGIPAVVPQLPMMEFGCREYGNASLLNAVDLTLMGVLVHLERTVLDWIEREFPGAAVVYVGHSGGSVVGYYASALDARITAMAMGYT